MQDFPANSKQTQATEAPRENLKPVTSAETVRRRRGLGQKFKETFFDGSARGAAQLTATEVIVPAIRDLVHDAMHNALDYLFYGDRTTRPRAPRSGIVSQATGHVAYNAISSPARPKTAQQRTLSSSAKARHDMGEIVIQSREAANEVIDRLFDVLSKYGEVSVANLYALTDIRPDHTDMKWGWTDLRGAKAVRTRQGGYRLVLPEPEALA